MYVFYVCMYESTDLPDNDLEKVEIGDQEIRCELIAGNRWVWTNAIHGHDPEWERACKQTKCQNDILQRDGKDINKGVVQMDQVSFDK